MGFTYEYMPNYEAVRVVIGNGYYFSIKRGDRVDPTVLHQTSVRQEQGIKLLTYSRFPARTSS